MLPAIVFNVSKHSVGFAVACGTVVDSAVTDRPNNPSYILCQQNYIEQNKVTLTDSPQDSCFLRGKGKFIVNVSC